MNNPDTARAAAPVAVIGAGPMGLAAAKTLKEQGIAFQGFEMHSDVGGLWDIDAPRSTMYETAHLISSKRMTEFTDFPMADDVADYPSHRERPLRGCALPVFRSWRNMGHAKELALM